MYITLPYAIFIVLIIVLIWYVSFEMGNKIESYQSFRDEHDDIREDPADLLREDDLWAASARDNIYDPDNLLNISDPQTMLHSQTFLDSERYRTHLMQSGGSDYMGQFAYDKNNLYRGSVMDYPSYKAGGYYLSPSYQMPPEDKFEAVRKGMNYYNFDHVDPLLRQIEAGTIDEPQNINNVPKSDGDIVNEREDINEREAYDNIGGDITRMSGNKEYLSNYNPSHVGIGRQDGEHAYMHLDIMGQGVNSYIGETADGYSYRDLDQFYDEEDYDNSGPGGTGPRELQNMPKHSAGMSAINMKGEVESDFIKDAEQNWYNVTNMGYNLDLENGAYGMPISKELNIYDPKQVDRLQYEQLGARDEGNALLNYDFTYNNGSENFMSGRDMPNHPTKYGPTSLERYPKPPVFPGETDLKYKSFITDISLATSEDRDKIPLPYEGDLWRRNIQRIPDHEELTS